MPKLWKRRRRQTNIENHAHASTNSSNPNVSSRPGQTVNKHQYRHYAANIRYSENDCAQNIPETSRTASTNVIIGILIMSVLICLMTMPDTTLRITMLGELLFCSFPPFFANWIVVLAILVPMKIQSRTEIVLGLAMLSWMSRLEWTYAWGRVRRKIDDGHTDSLDGMGPEA